MKQKTVLPASRFWSRKSIWAFSLVSVFLSPLKFHFRKTLKNLRLLLTSSRVFAITLLRIRINFRTWHTRTGCPEAPCLQKPACSATLSPTAGSVFARCGTRSKAGNKNAKGNTIFGGNPFPDYEYLKNYIDFGKLNGVQSPGFSEKK